MAVRAYYKLLPPPRDSDQTTVSATGNLGLLAAYIACYKINSNVKSFMLKLLKISMKVSSGHFMCFQIANV